MDRLPPPNKTKVDSNITELLVSAIQNYAPMITIALLLYGLAELFPIFSGDRSMLSFYSSLALRSIVAIVVIDTCVVYALWWALGEPGQTVKSFIQESFSNKYRYTDRNFILAFTFAISGMVSAVSVFIFFTGV
mgnify:CR=1 FL=1